MTRLHKIHGCITFTTVMCLLRSSANSAWISPVLDRQYLQRTLVPAHSVAYQFTHWPSKARSSSWSKSCWTCSSPSFRTEVHVKKLPIEVKLDDKCLLMGSCFAENIGARLQGYKFNVEVNPFGISYNPLSLAWNLERLLNETSFTAQDIVTSNGRCFSYKHHSSFTRSDAAAALSAINAAHTRGRRKLLETKVLFLTLGSAYAWRLKESGLHYFQ